MMLTVSTIFRKAADQLERDGWVQHTNQMRAARCLAQSLSDQSGGNANYASAVFRLTRFLGISGWRLVEWNDAEGRTAFEVINALRKAAEHYDEEDHGIPMS